MQQKMCVCVFYDKTFSFIFWTLELGHLLAIKAGILFSQTQKKTIFRSKSKQILNLILFYANITYHIM